MEKIRAETTYRFEHCLFSCPKCKEELYEDVNGESDFVGKFKCWDCGHKFIIYTGLRYENRPIKSIKRLAKRLLK